MTYVLEGWKWADDDYVTWSFASPTLQPSWTTYGFSDGIDDALQRDLMRQAFAAWSEVADIQFLEVADTNDVGAPDIRVGLGEFGSSDHSTLGMTVSRYWGDEGLDAIILMRDPAEWPLVSEDDGDINYRGTSASFLQVAIHEVGHAIGLGHSADAGSLMYSYASSWNADLSAEDVAGARALYGVPVESAPASPPLMASTPGLPGFNAAAYLAANPDVAQAGVDAWAHYQTRGWREGRDAVLSFDDDFYLARNPDVAAAGIAPYVHYLAFGHQEGRATAKAVGPSVHDGFDAQFYLAVNTDVARAGVDAWLHYQTFGWREGRDPNAYFDGSAYLEANPDVASAGVDPVQHYLDYGWREERATPGSLNGVAYLDTYGDVAAADINPLDHFLRHGINEGREIAWA